MARNLETVRVIPTKGAPVEQIINQRDYDSDRYDLTTSATAAGHTEDALDTIAEAFRTAAGIPTYEDFEQRANYPGGIIPTHRTAAGAVINHFAVTSAHNIGLKVYPIPDDILTTRQPALGYMVNDPDGDIALGDTTVPIDVGDVLIGVRDEVVFAGDTTTYIVTENQTGAGMLHIHPGLVRVPADNATLTINSHQDDIIDITRHVVDRNGENIKIKSGTLMTADGFNTVLVSATGLVVTVHALNTGTTTVSLTVQDASEAFESALSFQITVIAT